MWAAQMKELPGFSLMKRTDVQTIYHMQMPRWLFSDPRYADMSLDAKVTYTFLLNRFLLSRRIGGCRTSKNEEEPSLLTETYRKCLFYGRYKILYEAGTNEACIDAVLNSPLANVVTPPENDTTGRVLRSTRLEDSVYTDLRNGDDSLNQTERTAQKELAAYEAAAEFISRTAGDLDSKRRQVEAVGKMIDTNAAKNKDDLTACIAQAVSVAVEKAEEVQNIIGAWSNEPGKLEKNEVNTGLLDLVRKSDVLKDISKYLGRFREIFAQDKRNSYTYGRGEKYSLELGCNISRALTSELAMLASPKTVALFLRKYQRKQIKQYQRREPIYKGMGDIICCLGESITTAGDPAAWGKMTEEFYAAVKKEIAAYQERCEYLIQSGSQSPAVMDRRVLKVRNLETCTRDIFYMELPRL